jgi:hypothetical protein
MFREFAPSTIYEINKNQRSKEDALEKLLTELKQY